LALTRQNLPHLENSTLDAAIKGGYVSHEDKEAKLTLVSTGSEVSLCLEASKSLKDQGIPTRVVSLPCWEVFDAQPKEYRLSVLPDGVPIMSVEVMSTLGWEKYSHEQFGLNRFGASGPYKDVYKVSSNII
jgi:transketolase